MTTKNSAAVLESVESSEQKVHRLAGRQLNCLTFSSDDALLETCMITHKARGHEGKKVMIVTLLQRAQHAAKERVDLLAIEFHEGSGAVRIKAALNDGRQYECQALPGGQADRRQDAWQLLQRFVEAGVPALEATLAQMKRREPRQPGVEQCGKALLANDAAVSFLSGSTHATITMIHSCSEGAGGDKLLFTLPRNPADGMVHTVMKGLFHELACEDENRVRLAVQHLEELVEQEHGSRSFYAGERRRSAESLYRRVFPRTMELLEFWKKGLGPANSAEVFSFLYHNLEFETLRKRSGGSHLFPELRLALPPSYAAAGAYFVLRNGSEFEIKFKIPARKNAGAWQRLLSTIVETFARSPESLVDAYAHAIEDDSVAPFPITPENLRAFRHVVGLYRANQQAISAQLRELGDVRSDFQYRNGVSLVTFTRSPVPSLRFGLSFTVAAAGIASVSISGKRSLFGGIKRLRLPFEALDEASVHKVFALFYSDGEGSLERRKVPESLLYHFVLNRGVAARSKPSRAAIVPHPSMKRAGATPENR